MNKIIMVTGLVIVLIASFFTGMFFSFSQVKANASDDAMMPANAGLLNRLDQLEATMNRLESVQEEAADGNMETYLASIAESLAFIADKSQQFDSIAESLTQISERLAVIEEELAWGRLDKEAN